MRNLSSPYHALTGLTLLALAACGGGGSGDTAPVVVTPPVVVPVTPAALALTATNPAAGAATGIEIAPLVSFDAAPDMASVSATSVALYSAIGAVEARLTQTGNGVTLTPTTPLVWGSHYELRIADTVRGAAGGKLAAGSTIAFDTRAPAWSAASAIAGGAPAGDDLASGGAANGDTLTAWTELRAGVRQLVVSRYTAANGSWSAPAVLQDAARTAEAPDVGVNAAGQGVAVWAEQQDGGSYVVKAVRFDPAAGWGTPVTLSKAGAASAQGGVPRVAIGRNGNIVAVWKQPANAGLATIDSAYYDAASARWTATTSLQTAPADVELPIPAIGATGNASVLWNIKYATGQTAVGVEHARYDAGTKAWEQPLSLMASTDRTHVIAGLQLAVDGSDNVFASFKFVTPSRSLIYVNRLDTATRQWSMAEFDTVNNAPLGVQLGVDNAGNATLLWMRHNGGLDVLQGVRYQASTKAWTELRQAYHVGGMLALALRIDPAGNATFALSSKSGQNTNVLVQRIPVGDQDWTSADIVRGYQGAITTPVLTLDQSGQAVLAWTQEAGGSRSIGFSRLVGQ